VGQSVVYAEDVNMIHLRKFITTYLQALLDEYGFSIKTCEDSGNRFHGASIHMVSSEMEIFLAIERDEITAEFRSVFDKRKSKWYSGDIILTFIGHGGFSGVLDDRSASLIRDHLPEIINCFQKSKIEKTLKLLDEIKKERSKRGTKGDVLQYIN